MIRRSIQKLFGLIFIYILIIVGIFALQFRNQTIFSKNYYQLRLTLSQNKQENQDVTRYEDTFFVAFKGVTFFSDKDSKPYILPISQNDNEKSLIFENYETINDAAFSLNFSENVAVKFLLTGENHDNLEIVATLPKDTQLYLPYKVSKSYTITDSSKKTIVLKSSSTYSILTAPQIHDKRILLSSAQNTMTYENFKPVTKFSFETVSTSGFASQELYEQNISTIASICENKFDINSDITERNVNAYLAEMTAKNRYEDAIAKIPDSYKTSSRRTYLTSPYFGNLSVMTSSLTMQIENIEYKANYSVTKQNLDIFETEDLGRFLLTRHDSFIIKVLKIPSKMQNFSPTVQQAAGIIQTYVDVLKMSEQNAALLSEVIPKCVSVIEESCTMESNKLFVTQNGEKLPLINQVGVGNTLLSYGKITANATLQSCGYMLVNSALESNTQIALNTAGELYAILMRDNPFLPHYQVMHKTAAKTIWAWSASKFVSYTTDQNGTVTLDVEFPVGATHYMILKNVDDFSRIDIYGIRFRTDPRFETYNSSGYVYDENTKTLLLKYRHKSNIESIKMFYAHSAPTPQTGAVQSTPQSTITVPDQPAKSENAPQSAAQSATTSPSATTEDAMPDVTETPSANESVAQPSPTEEAQTATQNDEERFVGKWFCSGGVTSQLKYLEFNSDGTGKNSSWDNGSFSQNFTFVLDGNKITFSGRDFRGSDTTAVYEFSENSELVITFSNGKKGTYKKTTL